MPATFVVSVHGEPLMPTTNVKKVRRMLRSGKANIFCRDPFIIQLTYETGDGVQPIEMTVDAGYQHIGVSVKSESHEYASEERTLLADEKEKHDNQRRYRSTRRNRLRHRKPRFDNRNKEEGWYAPSIQNKLDRHIDLVLRYVKVAPIFRIVVEVGTFDTQLLAALEEGRPLPEGTDYQQGPRYQTATLREAVFQRDKYTCLFCGRNSFKDGAILHAHHVYFWRGQHGDRVSELATCCEKCHTQRNHQTGGKLWGFDKKLPRLNGAAFMNAVRWTLVNTLREKLPCEVKATYGAATKVTRSARRIEKSHANDAYCMGEFFPKHRCRTRFFKKRRRNNRCLEKFYDASYIDARDGKKRKGAEVGCGRTNRREPRNSEKNLRIYHGKKMSPGRRSIRKRRYPIQPGDILQIERRRLVAKGAQHYGEQVSCSDGKSYSVKKIKPLYHAGAWQRI